MQLAIALFNNDVDDEDELEFRKGDILTVLLENPNGLDGWWLCELKGKCGLCPGNRLKPISNPVLPTIKSNESTRPSSCVSTASMYDGLANDYDIPITASTSNHDYDIPQGSASLSNSNTPTLNDSSPESSSRSSGIYSTVDLRLSDLSSSSSSSSEFHTSTMNGNNNHIHLLSSTDIDQLQDSFRKLSIRSLLLDKYRQLISNSNIDSINRLFVNECRTFLHDYGCLLDRHTYKIFKQNLLYELEHVNNNNQRILQLATQIIQLIKPIIESHVKQKHNSFSSIPIDVFKKLHLEPIEELTNENENKKMTTSLSTTQIYANFHNIKSTANRTQMSTSKTCHSNFLLESNNNNNKSDDYDYIDDDYSTSSATDPLVKCYHRHIREHISTIFIRYSHLSQLNQLNSTSSLITEGKALIVAGHKLVFILETLHEHLRHSTKTQQIQTPLVHLTRQLCDTLTSFIRLLKQFSNQNCTNIQKFQHDTQKIMTIVKRIKQQCSSV